jgi:hypothetical protein
MVSLLLVLTGCGGLTSGKIYTDVTQPYRPQFHNTPLGLKRCVVKDYTLKEPYNGYLTVEWSTQPIQDALRKAGISRIAYIDEETFSLVFGIYKRKQFIIYGN